MRRTIEFFVCFIMVLMVIYMKPVISSHNQPKTKNNLDTEEIKPSHKAVPYYELNASGMAYLVGQTKDEMIKNHGQPKKEWQFGSDEEWLVYGDSTTDFYEVEIKEKVVTSVFVLGSELDSEPFTIDMDLTDLAEITTIFSNFKFDYGNVSYDVELTEEDMNYRPLVAFNNGTFAILHINQKSGKLIAIRYLDKKTLLEIMPYQLDEKNPYKEALLTNSDEIEWHQECREQVFSILNILRERENKQVYHYDSSLQVASGKALGVLMDEPQSILQDPERLAFWEALKEDEPQTSDPFILSEKELQKLVKFGEIKDSKTHGFLYSPVLDIPFMITNWYGNRLYHEEFTHKKDINIGMSFEDNAVLMFFNSNKEKPRTTESSEKR